MAADEDEDDYLSMSFEDPKPAKETSIQRAARLKKERAERGIIPSKAERKQAAEEAREKALATEIDSSNKGAQMLAKMGFKGGALGKTEGARTRPIEIQMKQDRGGLGMENDKKRKIREAADAANANEKRIKLTEEEYRHSKALEREEKRKEGEMWGAMRILEDFETNDATGSDEVGAKGDGTTKSTMPPLRSINVLYRPLVKQRLKEYQERRRMKQNMARRGIGVRDDYSSEDDQLASGTEVEDDLDEEDTELDEFLALPVGERLEKILSFLRETYHYCFWCKYRYPDDKMDGCPGLTDDEHG
ncbi:hypothetical protein PRZ48_010017 [Zasmidium cellare]|uniref:G-patch domain-containing protein n=1 Tax=Zasmidium cellare TaxID=395010 RepID=A0ABR0EDC9_ZASCE|nr:hypothetical protein PRZ48_010017 [Zasmidium cellare]